MIKETSRPCYLKAWQTFKNYFDGKEPFDDRSTKSSEEKHNIVLSDSAFGQDNGDSTAQQPKIVQNNKNLV